MARSTLSIASGKSQQFTILKIDTIFNFYKLKPPLSRFVDSFWIYEGYNPERKTERILPTGTLELVINLQQNELRFYDAERPENRSRLSGAIVSGASGRAFVIRVRDGVTEWVDVKRGASMSEKGKVLVEVFGDLSPGDQIAVRGTDELRAGTRVKAKLAAASK